MKLFERYDHPEGYIIPSGSFITFGRKIESIGYNGFYIVVRFFWSKKVRTIIDPLIYEKTTVPTYTSYIMMVRRIRNVGKMRFFFTRVYCPV